jgi:murein DD-endopeptidase MepM/ murein hydrolase activator NlpD
MKAAVGVVVGLAVVAAIGTPSAAQTGADTRAQEASLASEIAVQSERIDRLQAQAGALGSQVASLEAALARSRERLDALERRLAQQRRDLTVVRRSATVAQQRLERRLVSIYTADEPNVLEILLGASDLSSALDRLDSRDRAADLDRRLVDEARDGREKLTRARARTAALHRRRARETRSLASRTAARRALLASLLARRNTLSALVADRRRDLAAVRVRRSAWEAQSRALASASASVGGVTAAASALPTAPLVMGSGGFVWPVRGAIVSPFGMRWGRLHSGIDIAAPAGTPIVASAAGQVAFAGSMGGYGLIVVVQHANGLSTAYAHNSSIAVSGGQTVGQGQMIASVGCTGHCMGDHLHFEVRVNGSAVDPMAYL